MSVVRFRPWPPDFGARVFRRAKITRGDSALGHQLINQLGYSQRHKLSTKRALLLQFLIKGISANGLRRGNVMLGMCVLMTGVDGIERAQFQNDTVTVLATNAIVRKKESRLK